MKLSPVGRLTQTFFHELAVDQNQEISEARHNSFLEVIGVVEKRRNSLFRSLVMTDAVVAVIIGGQALKIPGLGISTAEFPLVLETLTCIASIIFFLAANSFFTWLCYDQIISLLNLRVARTAGVDPDFLSAAERPFEFFTKVFRVKFNLWGSDFFSPKLGFRIYSKIVIILAIAVILIPIVAHCVLIALSLHTSVLEGEIFLLEMFYVIAVVIINVGGLMFFLMTNLNFDFDFEHNAAEERFATIMPKNSD